MMKNTETLEGQGMEGKQLCHIDLFAGVGGFSYAIDKIYGKENTKHIFVENNLFCQAVLRKHWQDAEIHGDIRQFIIDTESARQRGNIKIDILTGGFPCQPFSQAGRRKGTADDRYLWREMFKVIQLYHPAWVIAENVRGLVTWNEGMVLEQVCSDLEREGYEVQPLIIPAVAVNAPHRRDRVWIVGHSEIAGRKSTHERQGKVQYGRTGTRSDKLIKNTIGKRSGWRVESERQVLERQSVEIKNARPDWEKNWIEVATRLCGVDARISTWMDGCGKVRNSRNERLKSLGNAIVPQVAMEILKAIKMS